MSQQAGKTQRLRIAARISFARRIDCDITMLELAKRCRMPAKKISDIEHGYVDLDVATLRVIAKALNTTAEELNRGACSFVRVEQPEDATA